MFCENCGQKLPENVKFCPNCGSPVAAVVNAADKEPTEPEVQPEVQPEPEVQPAQPQPEGRPDPRPDPQEAPAKAAAYKKRKTGEDLMREGGKISENIYFCSDGKYRWVYEMNLFRNPTVFILLFKIFFFIILGILAVVTIIDLVNGDFDTDVLSGSLKTFGIALGVMTGLLVVSYLIYCAIMGGKYIVMFEMDEEGINHKQMPKQAKKAKIIAGLTLLAGAAKGSLTTAGAGIAGSRTEMYSSFAGTKKVKTYPGRNLIKVNGILTHNQVYCEKEDFEFVSNYILERCTKAKK